jgi:hypothetical protein
MGASSWFYLVDDRDDVAAALHELRLRVFASGDYYKPDLLGTPPPSFEKFCRQMPSDFDEDELREEYDALVRLSTMVPTTPEEAVEKAAEEGTHSILDIDAIADQPKFGAALPMPEAELVRLFGSTRPERSAVEAARNAIDSPAGRCTAYHFRVYQNGVPRWLCFAGVSGD